MSEEVPAVGDDPLREAIDRLVSNHSFTNCRRLAEVIRQTMREEAERPFKMALQPPPALEAPNSPVLVGKEYSEQVDAWMRRAFDLMCVMSLEERNARFLEESLELVQATGMGVNKAHDMVTYVFNRPPGERPQEVGGVMVTLVALCNTLGLNFMACASDELARCWKHIFEIRAKQKGKPPL